MATMLTLRNQEVGVQVQSWFLPPRLFKEANMDSFAQKAITSFAPQGLRPSDLILQKKDEVYSYRTHFSLFRGQGKFCLDAEKLEVVFEKARDQNDLNIIYDCLLKAQSCFTSSESKISHMVQATSHAVFGSKDERDKFLQQFGRPNSAISQGGIIAYAPLGPAKEEIRFSLDRSYIYPEAVFLTWNMTTISTLNRDVCNAIQTGFRAMASKFDLTVALA
jgi:hypothetical protein